MIEVRFIKPDGYVSYEAEFESEQEAERAVARWLAKKPGNRAERLS